MSVTLTTPLSGTAVLTSGTAPSIGKLNIYNATSGAITATLPALSGLNVGARLAVQKYQGDSSANTVTVSCSGSDTFTYSGNTSVVLTVTGEQREIQVVSISGTKYWQHVGSWVPLAALDSRYQGGSGITSTATATGTTTLTSSSTGIQVFTGTATQTVLLPTTGVVAGRQFQFINNSTQAVTVKSSGANTIVVLGGNYGAAVFTALVATPTSATDWKYQLTYNNNVVVGQTLLGMTTIGSGANPPSFDFNGQGYVANAPAGNFADVAVNNDMVMVANSANVVLSARNNTGGIVFSTGSTDTKKMELTNAGVLKVGGNTVVAAVSVPSTATSTGTAGQIAYDSSYIYVCTATNTWLRAASSTW